MKAVILCAGKGTRMGDLTRDTPKPLLLYKEKTLIEHKLDALPDNVEEVILVIGYLGNKIKKYFGEEWKGRKITYIEQSEMLGTAHALFEAKHHLDRPFIVLMGDDLYGKEDLSSFSQNKDWAILVERPEGSQSGGKIIANEEGNLKEIVEDKDGSILDGLLYTGACLLTPEVFDLEMTKLPNGKEYGLPQTFSKAASTRPIKIQHATFWKRITSPEDLI